MREEVGAAAGGRLHTAMALLGLKVFIIAVSYIDNLLKSIVFGVFNNADEYSAFVQS